MNLQKHFTEVKDFRAKGRCLHELSDILIIVLLGTLADCSDFPEIEDYAKDKEAFFKRRIRLIVAFGDSFGRYTEPCCTIFQTRRIGEIFTFRL